MIHNHKRENTGHCAIVDEMFSQASQRQGKEWCLNAWDTGRYREKTDKTMKFSSLMPQLFWHNNLLTILVFF